MKIFLLLILLSGFLYGMQHEHIVAKSNGNSVTIDIDSSPRISSHYPHANSTGAKTLSDVEKAIGHRETDCMRYKVAAIAAAATVCSAVITAGVTVAITYTQCQKS